MSARPDKQTDRREGDKVKKQEEGRREGESRNLLVSIVNNELHEEGELK